MLSKGGHVEARPFQGAVLNMHTPLHQNGVEAISSHVESHLSKGNKKSYTLDSI